MGEEKMRKVELSDEQVRLLVESWRSAARGSLEQKLIEDLFLITGAVSALALLSLDIR
jgi:hypothetical protein